jgi:hypothetical protein
LIFHPFLAFAGFTRYDYYNQNTRSYKEKNKGSDDMQQYRGMIKWTQLAIPEHMDMIRRERTMRNIPQKPELDQQALEELHYALQEKMNHQEEATIHYWENNTIQTIKGRIQPAPGAKPAIKVVDKAGVKTKIEVSLLLKMN